MQTEATLRRRINALVSAIVMAVGLTKAGRSSGETYALVMSACELGLYTDVIGLCVASGILTETKAHWLTLTPKGEALLAEIRTLAA